MLAQCNTDAKAKLEKTRTSDVQILGIPELMDSQVAFLMMQLSDVWAALKKQAGKAAQMETDLQTRVTVVEKLLSVEKNLFQRLDCECAAEVKRRLQRRTERREPRQAASL